MKNTWNAAVLVVAAVCASFLVSTPVGAQQPITGSIDFGGTLSFDTQSLATATQVNDWLSSFVLRRSGDFMSVSPGSNAIMAEPWEFDSGTPATPLPGPATNDLWSAGTFTFDLDLSNVVSQSSNFLHVTGSGSVSSTNPSFMTTPGLWSFTVSNSNGQDQVSFGFQANSTAVPEAGTITLLTLGGIGLGGIALKRKKS